MPVHGPEPAPEPILIQRHAMVRVVHMVIIDRGQTREQNRAADERLGALRLAENLCGIERRTFDRKFLPGVQAIPGKAARLRERTHLARCGWKLADPGPEPPV